MLRRLLGQSMIYGVTTLVSRGALVVLLLLLPFIVSPAEYGVLAMVTALAAVVNVMAPLEITQGVVRLYVGAEGKARWLYVSTAWWFTIFSLALFLLVTGATAPALTQWILGSAEFVGAFRLGLAVMALTSLFYFLQNQFRWEFRTGEYVAASLLFSLLSLSLSLGAGLLADRPLEGILAGQAAGAAIANCFAMWRLRGILFKRIDGAKLRAMLHISIPIVPASLALLFSLYASRFILNDLAGLQAVGIYSFASQIAGIAGLTLVGVQAAVTPLIMAHHEEADTPRLLGRTFEMFTGLALIGCLLLGLFAPELITAFGSPTYRAAGLLVLPLALAVVAGGMYFFLPGFLIGKQTKRQMWVSCISAAATIALNYLLISWFDLQGAVAATLAGSLIFMTLWFLFSQPYYPVPIRWRAVIFAGISTLAGGLAALSIDYPSLTAAIATKLAVSALVGAAILKAGLVPIGQGRSAVTAFLRKRRANGSPSDLPQP